MTRMLVAALTVWTLGFGLGAGRANAQSGDATEKLLKDTGLDYTKVKGAEGVFKLVIETKDGASVVFVEEKAVGKDSKGNPIQFAYVYSEVLLTPADFKPSVAMLTKLAEINDTTRWGSVGFSKNKDGSYSMFRNSSFFLKNLDAEQMRDYLVIVHFDKLRLKKEFAGFIAGGQ